MTLKTITTQVVETSVTVNNNSPIQDYVQPDDHTQPSNEMTPRFKTFTVPEVFVKVSSAQFPSVSLRRTPFELALSVHLREMIGSQIKGLRKTGANFRYPFYRGVRLIEVSVKRESTVYPNFCDVSDTFARFNTQWRGELVEESQDLLSSNLLVSTVSYKKSPLSSSTMLCGQSNRWCNSCFYEQIRR